MAWDRQREEEEEEDRGKKGKEKGMLDSNFKQEIENFMTAWFAAAWK